MTPKDEKIPRRMRRGVHHVALRVTVRGLEAESLDKRRINTDDRAERCGRDEAP